MNKKFSLLCLLLLLPLALFACGDGGAGGVSDTVPQTQETEGTAPLPQEVTGISVLGVVAERGGLAKVTISIKGNPGLEGINLHLLYDAEVLTPVSATGPEGGLFVTNAQNGTVPPMEGTSPYVTLVWASATGITQEGELFTVTFRVREDGKATQSALSLSAVELKHEGEDIDLPLHPGQLKIVDME